jgi:hypothetical protein
MAVPDVVPYIARKVTKHAYIFKERAHPAMTTSTRKHRLSLSLGISLRRYVNAKNPSTAGPSPVDD